MSVKNILEKFDDRIVKAVTIFATTSLSVTCIVTLLQVFLRRVFNSPIVWAEDLAVFIFIWITFLGAAILFQKKALISVDSFVMLFSEKVRLIIEAIVDLIVSITSFYLLKLSVDFMNRQRMLGHNLGGALGIPSWVVTCGVIISIFLIIIFGLTLFIKKIILLRELKGVKL